MARLLVVEDDEHLRLALEDNLRDEGHDVVCAATAAQASAAAQAHAPELVVLDVMLPDGDGYRWCQAYRQAGGQARVLMLTARTLEDDVVRGFEAGADDYLAKPYRLRELFARIGALLRRGPSPAKVDVLEVGAFTVNLARREVRGPGGAVELTKKEFDLLVVLAQADRVLTRDELLDAVWGEGVMVDPHTVDNFVGSLKKKLKADRPGFALKTVRGVGFQLQREGA